VAIANGKECGDSVADVARARHTGIIRVTQALCKTSVSREQARIRPSKLAQIPEATTRRAPPRGPSPRALGAAWQHR
jgi:hypothetical protein